MFDTKTLMPIKTIEVQGNPDGMMFDTADERKAGMRGDVSFQRSHVLVR